MLRATPRAALGSSRAKPSEQRPCESARSCCAVTRSTTFCSWAEMGPCVAPNSRRSCRDAWIMTRQCWRSQDGRQCIAATIVVPGFSRRRYIAQSTRAIGLMCAGCPSRFRFWNDGPNKRRVARCPAAAGKRDEQDAPHLVYCRSGPSIWTIFFEPRRHCCQTGMGDCCGFGGDSRPQRKVCISGGRSGTKRSIASPHHRRRCAVFVRGRSAKFEDALPQRKAGTAGPRFDAARGAAGSTGRRFGWPQRSARPAGGRNWKDGGPAAAPRAPAGPVPDLSLSTQSRKWKDRFPRHGFATARFPSATNSFNILSR